MARPRGFDEREVLDAARDRFWRQGYDGTSMSELCAATGLRSQSLYGAFGSKHGLFVRTLEDYCTSQVDGMAGGERVDGSPWAWIVAAVTFDDGGRLELGEDGCYLAGTTAALARRDGDVREAAQGTYERIRELFVDALRRARERGELREGVVVEDAAMAALTAMQGIEFLRKSGLDERRFAQAKRSAVEMLTAAYAA